MRNGNSEKSTKELILDAAFSFCDAPRFKVFSLSEVAAKVGISKPAIYRHFKSKDDLYEAMEKRLYDELAVHLSHIMSEKLSNSKVPFARLIDFLVKNPCYINYFIAKLSSEPDYEKKSYEELKRRLSSDFENNYEIYGDGSIFKDDTNVFSQHVFCGISIFFLVKIQEKLISSGIIKEAPENYADRVVDFMLNGLRGMTQAGDFFHLEELSVQRMAELDDVCSIKDDYLPEEDRIFTALANVIKKYTISGITIERIADELNMAKSSLYEYFDNKNQLVKNLIGKSMALLKAIIIENSVEAKSLSEHIYIMMRTELEYFIKRPSVIPICGWILMTSEQNVDEHEHENLSFWLNKMPENLDERIFGYPFKAEMILGWIGCLPAGLLVEASKHGFGMEKSLESLKVLFNFVVNGIK